MMERELQFGDVLRITINAGILSWYKGFPAIFMERAYHYPYMVKTYNRQHDVRILSSARDAIAYIGSDDLLTYINIL